MGFHREHCRRKRRYRTRQQAQEVLDRMVRQGKTRGGEQLTTYRCPFCERHHIGHVPSMESLEAMALEIRGLERPDRPEQKEAS